MALYIFETKNEFIVRAYYDLGFTGIVEWAQNQTDLKAILKNCPVLHRKHCILAGYLQFAIYTDKNLFDEKWWNMIFIIHPEMKKYLNI